MTREEAKEYLDNYRKMYAELAPERFLEALDIMLNEPSLPSNLDEAAEESMQELEKKLTHVQFDETTTNWLKYMFKAGAKWVINNAK